MKKIHLILSLAVMLLAACSKKEDTPENELPEGSFQGPVSRPSSGYGSEGSFQVSEISIPNPGYPGTVISIFHPAGQTSARPVIFFSHPYGGESKAYNKGLFQFIAGKGYVVVFVPYPTFGVSIDERYAVLWAGFTRAAADYPEIINTKRVGFMGHSFGGGASVHLAYRAFTEKGWGGEGRFLFTMAPWYSYQISEQQLQNFPVNTQLVVQVYDEDTTNDHRLAMDIFTHLGIPESEKDFYYLRSSIIDGYIYRTDHQLPNTRSAYDALDYYGVYRILDALMDYSFNKNIAAKTVALGNGSAEQRTMPSYNGQQMAPLEITDQPQPKYPQSRYTFRCSSTDNPRSGYCQ